MVDERLSNLIGLIYEAALQPGLWAEILPQVAAVTPCAEVALYSHDTVAQTPTFHRTHGQDPAYVQQYIDRWAANPIIDALAALEPGQVSGLAGIMDYDAFTRHPFYLEWGRPQRYCDVINIVLERTPTRLALVSLIRNDDHGVADRESLERVRVLAPHLLRSIRIGRVLESSALRAETLAATLDRLASPVLVLGTDGALVHANRHAVDLMSDGLTLGRIIRASQIGGGMSPPAARDAGGSAGADDKTFVVEASGTARFICHAMALRIGVQPPSGAANLHLIVIQSAMSTDAAIADAASLFGLTARERDILFGVVEIGGAPMIARTLGLSRATVQTHLKSLFAKTRTHRQADLVGLVSGLMSPFRRSG